MQVRTLIGFQLPETELIFIQERGFPGFGELDVDTKLRTFWDTFTWEILDSQTWTDATRIAYVKSIISL